MANNPYVNKVVFGSATLVDLTGTTATADKILSGYGAYGADGAWMDGTATSGGTGGNVWQDAQGYVHLDDEGTPPVSVESLSVTQNGTYTAPTGKAYSPVTVNVSGSGGLEYETGTWTPSEDVLQSWIYFTDTHTDLPLYISLSDSTGTLASANSNVYISIELFSKHSSERVYYNATAGLFGRVSRVRRSAADTGISTDSISITEPTSSMISSEQKYPRYWVTEEGFCNNNSSSYSWRAGRTYKWIAVWAPTT